MSRRTIRVAGLIGALVVSLAVSAGLANAKSDATSATGAASQTARWRRHLAAQRINFGDDREFRVVTEILD